jgi:type I restriction enzyme, S subunit
VLRNALPDSPVTLVMLIDPAAIYPIATIEEIAAPDLGAIKIGPFGSQLKKDELSDQGYKVYGQENVIARDFSLGNRRVSVSKFDQLKSCRLFPGDVVVTMMGTIGRCAVVPSDAEIGIMDSHLLRIQLSPKRMMPEFIVQVFTAEGMVMRQIMRMSHGSIMSGLSSRIVRRLEVPLPSIPEQRRILEILSAMTM